MIRLATLSLLVALPLVLASTKVHGESCDDIEFSAGMGCPEVTLLGIRLQAVDDLRDDESFP